MNKVASLINQIFKLIITTLLLCTLLPLKAYASDVSGGGSGTTGGDGGSESAMGLDLRWWGFSKGGWNSEDIPDSSEYLSGTLLKAPEDKKNSNGINEQRWFGTLAYDEGIFGEDCIWATALATKSNRYAGENLRGNGGADHFNYFANNYTLYDGKASEVGDYRVDFFKKLNPHNQKDYLIGYQPSNWSGNPWNGAGGTIRKSHPMLMGTRQVDSNGVVVEGGAYYAKFVKGTDYKLSGTKINFKEAEQSDVTVLTEIHFNASQFTVTRTYYDINKTIIKTENTNNDFDNSYLEGSENGRKWLYENPIEYGEYGDTTPPTNSGTKKSGVTQDYCNNIKVTTEDIKKTVTIKFKPGMTPEDVLGIDEDDRDTPENRQKLFDEAMKMVEAKQADPSYENITDDDDNIIEEYNCETSTKKTMNRTITYRGEQPPCDQTYFKPLNVNRQGYAQIGDGGLTGNFANASHGLEAATTNQENISTDQDLNALDINNDHGFTYTIESGNNQLGLPLYDFLSEPPALANGSWEYATGSYANGRVGDMTDVSVGSSVGYYRYNVKSSSSLTGTAKLNGSNVDVTSLVAPNGIEYTSSESYDTSANAGTVNTRYGDWITRFAYNGKFTTDNGYGLTDWRKNWWMIKYNQDRFFEYGITYHGTYDLNNIYSADQVEPTGAPKASKTTQVVSGIANDIFTTNGINQRGLYVGLTNKIFYQPVLYGHWNVKTLAGDIN